MFSGEELRTLSFPDGGQAFPSKVTEALTVHVYERMLACCLRVMDTRAELELSKACAAIVDLPITDVPSDLLGVLTHPLLIARIAAIEMALDESAERLEACFADLCMAIPDLLVANANHGHTFTLTRAGGRAMLVLSAAQTIRLKPPESSRGLQVVLADGNIDLLDIDGECILKIEAHDPRHSGVFNRTLFRGAVALSLTGHETVSQFSLDELPGVLGGTPASDWLEVAATQGQADRFSQALDFLRQTWPEGYLDVTSFMRAVIPVNTASGVRAAVSSPALPGAVALSLPNLSVDSAAELLLHEVAHLKIDLAHLIDPLLHDDGSFCHSHPWRSDKRTITGVLYAVHAFVTELALCEAVRESFPSLTRHPAEIDRLCVNLATSASYLQAHGKFTVAGERFYANLMNAVASLVGRMRGAT